MSLSAPTSEVDIYNLALEHLKQALIDQIEPPTSVTEELCHLWYHQIRQETLRGHPWNFTVARTQLSPAGDSTPAFGCTHAYLLLSGRLRFLGRYDDLGNRVQSLLSGIESRSLLFHGDDNTAINVRALQY